MDTEYVEVPEVNTQNSKYEDSDVFIYLDELEQIVNKRRNRVVARCMNVLDHLKEEDKKAIRSFFTEFKRDVLELTEKEGHLE